MVRSWTAAWLAVIVMVPMARATPVPPSTPPAKTPDQWEYCEVQLRQTARAAVGAVQVFAVRVVTAEEEIEVATWSELADKLSVKPGKKDLSEAIHKMRVLNHLGSQGWELVSHHQPTTTTGTGLYTWTFRKKTSK